MKPFEGMLKTSDGQCSTIRVLSFFVVFVIMTTWSIVSLVTGKIQPMGYDNALIVASVVGAKVAQKKLE